MKSNHHHQPNRKSAAWLLPLLLAGCSDELYQLSPGSSDGRLPLELGASIEQVSNTRADDTGFADGDRFGVFVVNYSEDLPGTLTLSANQANNVAFTFNADSYTWKAATDIYWRDNTTPVDVYGYYPFNNSIDDVEAYRFEVESDQSIVREGEMGAYEASDFLWAKASGATPAGGKINLGFGHRMAGMKVILVKGGNIDESEWNNVVKTVAVNNVTRYASIDLSTGVVTPEGAPDRQIRMADQKDDTYRGVVVPQTLAENTKLLSITIENVSYTHTLKQPLKLESGKLYNFTLEVNKKENQGYEVKLVDTEITPWENDKLTHNFFEYEYTTVRVDQPGTLAAAIESMGKNKEEIQNLKIIGPINADDFTFMREQMTKLAMLNMKESQCKDVRWVSNEETSPNHWEDVVYQMDNAIPQDAFCGKSSLRRIIFPDEIEYIGKNAFREIGLDINSSIVLPRDLKYIGERAFGYIGEAGELVLNDKIEYVGYLAFAASAFRCELSLPQTLKYIGDLAFGTTGNTNNIMIVTGNFRLPDNLEYIGDNPFEGIEFDGVGEMIVPQNMTELHRIFPGFKRGATITFHDNLKKIDELAFQNKKFINKVVIPSKVTHIESGAFYEAVFNAGLSLPSSLKSLGESTFMGASGLGDLELPNGVEIIPGGCFGRSDLNSIVLPNSVISIEADAFACDVKSVTIDKNCSYIGRRAFSAPQLQTLICLNPEPPYLDGIDTGDEYTHPFRECNLDQLVLQVPEGSVELYRHTEGWNRIRFITAYHELSVGVSELQCLDKGLEYNTLLRADGEWTVECPDWVKVTPSSGYMKRNEITIKVSPTTHGDSREGEVVFKLKNKNYSTSVKINQLAFDKGEDTEIELHKASKGKNEIPVLFVGEGFTANDIIDGKYLQMIESAYQNFFAIEPYKSYKDYFTASYAVAVSPDSGIERNYMESTKFHFRDQDGSLTADWDKIRNYAAEINQKFNTDKALIVVVPNYDSFMGLVEHSDTDADIALCGYSQDTYPYDFRGTIQHYAGGVAFGKLAPEYVTHYEFVKGCTCPGCNPMSEYRAGAAKGWYGNVSMTGSSRTLPWQHYIFHEKYSHIVDVYEGAFRHLRGAYRSENQSCMSTYIQYFNTISRELIVRRIMSLSGEEFNLDNFINNDSLEGNPN